MSKEYDSTKYNWKVIWEEKYMCNRQNLCNVKLYMYNFSEDNHHTVPIY